MRARMAIEVGVWSVIHIRPLQSFAVNVSPAKIKEWRLILGLVLGNVNLCLPSKVASLAY